MWRDGISRQGVVLIISILVEVKSAEFLLISWESNCLMKARGTVVSIVVRMTIGSICKLVYGEN
jgi:hypothetical protein